MLPFPTIQVLHVGGTAISGSLAKRVLNILIILEKEALRTQLIDALGKTLIFPTEVMEGLYNAFYFNFYNQDKSKRYVCVHEYVKRHPEIARLLGFCNLLQVIRRQEE